MGSGHPPGIRKALREDRGPPRSIIDGYDLPAGQHVIIDAINDRNGRNELLEGVIAEGILLACCSINLTEVHMGMRPHEAERTEEFLGRLEFYPVTPEVAKYAGELYREWRQKGLTLARPDLTVAAVTIRNGLLLATDNPKDFPMPELWLYTLP